MLRDVNYERARRIAGWTVGLIAIAVALFLAGILTLTVLFFAGAFSA